MKTIRSNRSRAAAVSRFLAKAGHRPLPSGTSRSREGVRVSPTGVDGDVFVVVDWDTPAAAARRALELTELLNAAGFSATVSGNRIRVFRS